VGCCRWATRSIRNSAFSHAEFAGLIWTRCAGAGSIGRCYTAWTVSVSNRCCGVSHPSVFRDRALNSLRLRASCCSIAHRSICRHQLDASFSSHDNDPFLATSRGPPRISTYTKCPTVPISTTVRNQVAFSRLQSLRTVNPAWPMPLFYIHWRIE
jgi:hypothetical protein